LERGLGIIALTRFTLLIKHHTNHQTPKRPRSFTISAGRFVVCTAADGVSISNTATLTPQQAGSSGVAIPKTATVRLTVWGCDRPPDVNFQELMSWGAVPFTWALQHRAQRCARGDGVKGLGFLGAKGLGILAG
jgi:hypothetical protein